MSILFFQDGAEAHGRSPAPPEGYSWTLWRPGLTRVWPVPDAPLRYLVWWLLHQARLFGNRDYAVFVISHGAQAVHRSAVFPRWLRSPFMAARDLQIGDTWTAPEHRGRGLATLALLGITHQMAAPARRFWYLVERDNEASVRAVRRAGFTLTGEGARQPRFGISALGAYRLHSGAGT